MTTDMNAETIFVVDESGKEIEMTVLFTIESPTTHRNIVCYFDEDDESGQVFASYYDEEGNLEAVEDQKEWEFVEEVFGAFLDENEKETD
jgi:uncharacterized protein YrzB (UPF0473 family)